MSYTVQVDYRTASSFLVAYSINLSRGGVFLETDVDVPPGARMTIDFLVSNVGTTSINGVVAWRRGLEDPASGPPGIAVEFDDITPELGALIDHLVESFDGVRILLVSNNQIGRAHV